jgi:RimJ/RimL family protein N-acetyltransferase
VAPGIYELETPRLWLRCFEPGDADSLQAVLAGSRRHLARFLPWAEAEPQSRAEKLGWILARRAEFDSGGDRVFGIFEGPRGLARAAGPSALTPEPPGPRRPPAAPQAGRLLGGVGLHRRQNGPAALEIGYWLAEPHLGRGFAREATAALVRLGFERLGLAKLEIRVVPENHRSRRIPEALGFQLDGVLRAQLPGPDEAAAWDACVYSLLASEFQPASPLFPPIACFDAAGAALGPQTG